MGRILHNSRRLVAGTLAAVLLGMFFCAAAGAEEVADREELLRRQAYLFWQRINEARRDPRAVLERLAIPEEQARTVLGEDSWLLESGLRPLAWDGSLTAAAAAHGRDMVTRLYYSHLSPEGLGPRERMHAQGYLAIHAEETLGMLVFVNPVSLEESLDVMVDYMLRDELTGTPGVARNVFSPRLTEMGLSFLAESVQELAGQPYLYLVVADFAKPVIPRGFIVGRLDPGHMAGQRYFATGEIEMIPLLPGGSFQVPYPQGGCEVGAVDDQWRILNVKTFYDMDNYLNHHVDLRVSP